MSLRLFLIGLPGAAALGVAAGAGALVAGFLSHSASVAVGVAIVAPALAIRLLYADLPAGARWALAIVSIGVAVLVMLTAVSSYSS